MEDSASETKKLFNCRGVEGGGGEKVYIQRYILVNNQISKLQSLMVQQHHFEENFNKLQISEISYFKKQTISTYVIV